MCLVYMIYVFKHDGDVLQQLAYFCLGCIGMRHKVGDDDDDNDNYFVEGK